MGHSATELGLLQHTLSVCVRVYLYILVKEL
jgi:hypothetical protein